MNYQFTVMKINLYWAVNDDDDKYICGFENIILSWELICTSRRLSNLVIT